MKIYTETHNGFTERAFAILPFAVVDWSSDYVFEVRIGWLFWAIEIQVDT